MSQKTSTSAPDIAFIAGIIDCRGHIEITDRHGTPQPRVRVTTKRHRLLEFLASKTGVSVRQDTRGYVRRPCGDHCAQQHQHVVRQSSVWTVDSARATIVLWNVSPYIVSQKAEVERALRAGLDAWPAKRGDTATQMAKLGWALPKEVRG